MTEDADKYLQDRDKAAVYEQREATRVAREAKEQEERDRRDRTSVPVGNGRFYKP